MKTPAQANCIFQDTATGESQTTQLGGGEGTKIGGMGAGGIAALGGEIRVWTTVRAVD